MSDYLWQFVSHLNSAISALAWDCKDYQRFSQSWFWTEVGKPHLLQAYIFPRSFFGFWIYPNSKFSFDNVLPFMHKLG